MHRHAPSAVLCTLVAIPIAVACGDASHASDASIVRDSAGVRIVENHRPQAEEPWTIDAEPNVEIGADERDPMQQLFRVAGAVVLSDGRIVVAHGPEPMLRWYSADGVYEQGTGRPGGGPGEFGGGESAWIASLWAMPGDSIATWEHPPRRMQVFSPSAEYVRQVVLELPHDMPTGSYPQIRGRLHGGFAGFLLTPFEPGPMGEVRQDTWRYIRFRSDGSYAGSIAALPGRRTFTDIFRQGGREFPTQGSPLFAPVPVSTAHGDRFYYGPADRYEIAVYDSTGALMLVRRSLEPRPVTTEIVAALREVTMARAPDDPAARREWERSIAEAPVESTLPMHRAIRVDRTGHLWVQAYALPGAESAEWSVFDADGRWLSDVTIPESWQIMDIGEDYVLALWRDELDVEHVRKHRLRRGW